MTIPADNAPPHKASKDAGFVQLAAARNAVQTPASRQKFADTALKFAAGFWFLVAVIGQLMFVIYIAAFYGGSAAQGNWAAWNKVLPHGYTPGDTLANAAIASHLFLAAIITLGGPLQLIPQIRSYAPTFHRWNGRVYLLTAATACISGLYMMWFRGGFGDVVQHLGLSLDAILILLCGAMALRYAIARDIKTHRRWALRLFMVVSGVWFFRVGLMFWIFVNNGPVGFDPKTFTGPFLNFLAFADYLLPLTILEIYLRVRDRAGVPGRLAMSAGLLVLTIAMGVGIFVATMGLWLPRM